MKTYEKPMAIVEKIECEDIMTSSGDPTTLTAKQALATAAGVAEDNTIIFEW